MEEIAHSIGLRATVRTNRGTGSEGDHCKRRTLPLLGHTGRRCYPRCLTYNFMVKDTTSPAKGKADLLKGGSTYGGNRVAPDWDPRYYLGLLLWRNLTWMVID